MTKPQIKQFTLGPLANNSYLIIDRDHGKVVVIDPAIGSGAIKQYLEDEYLRVEQIWITHAHFDHFAGINELETDLRGKAPIYIHRLEHDYMQSGGGIREYFDSEWTNPKGLLLCNFMEKNLFNQTEWKVLHTPGHRPGHVVFYSEEDSIAFCGDLIFQSSIGRTDLAGGDYSQLIHSIRQVIFSLPEQTILLPGHGPSTTVGEEKKSNPFLR